jgi:diaminopimelate decarboxylase
LTNYLYKNSTLYIEDISINQLYAHLPTPFYCYSQSSIENAYLHYKNSSPFSPLICFALKANSNQAIIKVLADLGAGADVVSQGEMRRALNAGIPANKIVYSGIAKTKQDMQFALEHNIFQFNIESENELLRLSQVASKMKKIAAIALRINPNVDAKTHKKILTGKSENKFGIPIKHARQLYKKASELPYIKVQGVDVHIGSQLTSLTPFKEAFQLILRLVNDLKQDGHTISVIDLGGGLGINYQKGDMDSASVSDYCQLIDTIFKPLNCQIILEPGRSLVAESGLLVSEVIYKKQGDERTFLIIDAAMNDLLRPSLYDAYHSIIPIQATPNDPPVFEVYDIVGPVCETGDTFAQHRTLPQLNEGDLIGIQAAGAYGASMASTYNTRLLIPEILVKNDQWSIIKKRQTYDELLSMDTLASWQE